MSPLFVSPVALCFKAYLDKVRFVSDEWCQDQPPKHKVGNIRNSKRLVIRNLESTSSAVRRDRSFGLFAANHRPMFRTALCALDSIHATGAGSVPVQPVATSGGESAEASNELTAEQQAAWTESVRVLVDMGAEQDAVDRWLRKGFGWEGQGYWREEVVNEVPTADRIKVVLDYLRTVVGLSEADVPKVLGVFPELMALDVEDRIKSNVEYLRETYRTQGAALTNMVKRRPQVLGVNVDCGGDCKGECNRCWVRF